MEILKIIAFLFMTYIFCNGELYTHMVLGCQLNKKEENRKECTLWQCPGSRYCPYCKDKIKNKGE